MKIKKLLTPLLLILLLASIVVFGAPQPMGPYFDDTYLEYGNDGLNVKTATVTDGDTTHVPTSDNVYDFCETTQDYMQDLEDDTAPKLGGNLDANDHAILENVTTVTTTHTMTVAEAGTVLVSASSDYTITLPTAVGNAGLTYKFKKTDANYNCITLDGDGTETINYENADGVPKETYARLNTYGAEVTLVSDGSNWQAYDEALGQVPTCYAYLSADQLDLTASTFIRVDLDTTSWDVGSNFDTSIWVSGNATSTSTGHLVDSGGAFTSAMVGKRVKNTTDSTYTYITAYNSETDVTVRDDIFVDTEGYEILNSRYVIPVSGTYYLILNANVKYGSTIADKEYQVYYDSTEAGGFTSTHATSTFGLTCYNALYVEFTADDEVSLGVNLKSGANTCDLRSGEGFTHMEIRLISKD